MDQIENSIPLAYSPMASTAVHTSLDFRFATQICLPQGALVGGPSAFGIGLEGFYWKQKEILLGCYKLTAIFSHNLGKTTTFHKQELKTDPSSQTFWI